VNLPRRGGRRRDRPGRGAIGVAGTATRENHLVRVREIGVIQNVEDLRSELRGPLLADSEPFEKWSVHVNQARPAERSARHVPEGPGNRQREGVRIEPVVDRPQNHRPFKVRIPVGYIGHILVACPGVIETDLRREREPVLRGDDPVPLWTLPAQSVPHRPLAPPGPVL